MSQIEKAASSWVDERSFQVAQTVDEDSLLQETKEQMKSQLQRKQLQELDFELFVDEQGPVVAVADAFAADAVVEADVAVDPDEPLAAELKEEEVQEQNQKKISTMGLSEVVAAAASSLRLLAISLRLLPFWQDMWHRENEYFGPANAEN